MTLIIPEKLLEHSETGRHESFSVSKYAELECYAIANIVNCYILGGYSHCIRLVSIC